MIVKVPVYLSLEEKLHPDEVSEVTEVIRVRLTKFIKSTADHFTIEFLGREIRLEIITSAEVKALMTGSTLGQLRKTAKIKISNLRKK